MAYLIYRLLYPSTFFWLFFIDVSYLISASHSFHFQRVRELAHVSIASKVIVCQVDHLGFFRFLSLLHRYRDFCYLHFHLQGFSNSFLLDIDLLFIFLASTRVNCTLRNCLQVDHLGFFRFLSLLHSNRDFLRFALPSSGLFRLFLTRFRFSFRICRDIIFVTFFIHRVTPSSSCLHH